MNTDTLVMGGGCFWCLDAAFREVAGVTAVVSGYTGGQRTNPTYEQVCSGATGHAEVVQVTFDTDRIQRTDILDLFFALHDPTTLNRQGNDVGTQYRSALFYADEREREQLQAYVEGIDAKAIWGSPVVTTLEPLAEFYPAEDYHQDYYRRNPGNGYCQVMITPKLAKLRRLLQT